MKIYKCAVLGGTFEGLGIASANSKSIIVERGSQIGNEFLDGFCLGGCWEYKPAAKEGRELRRLLAVHKLLSEDGRVNIGGVGALVNHYIIDKSIDVLLLTEVIDIVKENGLYKIKILNIAGADNIFAERIYHAKKPQIKGDVFLNSIISSAKDGCIPEPWHDDIYFTAGYYPNEVIFSLRSNGVNLPNARQKVFKTWKSRPSKYSSWKIAALAMDFDRIKGGGYFDNFLMAFDVGAGGRV